MNKPRDNSLGEGIYFELESYAGFIRRFAAIIIDFIVLLALYVFLSIIPLLSLSIDAIHEYEGEPDSRLMLLMIAIAWGYLVILKPSKWRTVGYRMTGLKIINTRGNKPSIFTMTFRLLLWMFGPFHLLFDLIWLSVDSERQSLRDCYSGTYVVRANAEPIGTAPIHLAYYNALGYSFMYPRVVRPKVPD